MKAISPSLISAAMLLAASFAWASATDHTQYVKGPFKSGEDVTKTCLQCHDKQADDFIKTPHWKWKGIPRTVKGMENSKEEYGKSNMINNFCISIQGGEKCANEEFCSKCHPSYGWKDSTFNFKDKMKIDCLVCHAREGNYRKGLAGEPDRRLMEQGKMSLTKAAQSVGSPTRDNCGVCHFFGGGGDAVKHGDLDSTMAKPTREHDVHMGGYLDMSCQGCHATKDHRISGASTFLATNDGRVACADCHRDPHKNSPEGKALSKHLPTVACQTCHIPAFARGQATKMSWDWSELGKDIEPQEQYGKEDYAKHKGRFIWEMNVTPTYAWYNGQIERYMKGDKVSDASKTVYISRPVGSIKDTNAKIFPFKVHKGKQPMDSAFRYLLVPQTYKGVWEHFDWEKGLVDGAKGSGLPYSGKFQFVSTAFYGSINHEVAPKDQALKCKDCHMGGKRLDWKALGYAGDPMRSGSRFETGAVSGAKPAANASSAGGSKSHRRKTSS